jgi:hypothetical protein
MHRRLKVLPLTLAIAALAALSIIAASCGSSGTQARFVNAIPDTADYGDGVGLDIEVNGTKQFTDIAFPSFSASTYTGIPSGSVTIEGFETNTSTEVFDQQNISLNSGSQYTLVATGSATGTNGNNVVLLNPTDNNTEPANGTVSFRVINASPHSPAAVDVWILPAPFTPPLAEPATIKSVAYQSASGYTNIPYNSSGGGFLLFVTLTGNTSELIINGQAISVGSVSAGSIRTLVLTDVANDPAAGINSTALVLSDLN